MLFRSLTDLHDDGFDPTLTLDERLGQFEPPESKAVVTPYAEHLRWAEAIVFVYPTWWSGPPALLKGWFDRVWVSGLAYNPPNGTNHITARLTNIRRLMVVTTHGSSKWVNAVQGEPGKRVMFRALRLMCHPFTRTSWASASDVFEDALVISTWAAPNMALSRRKSSHRCDVMKSPRSSR